MNGRKTWLQADLRCMLCGRVLGSLIGQEAATPALSSASGTIAARARHPFSLFRPTDSGIPIIRLRGNETFRCGSCRGAAIADETVTFYTYDDTFDDEAVTDRPRRGRPPKPWRPRVDSRLSELGLAG